jgi:hypothetical protein
MNAVIKNKTDIFENLSEASQLLVIKFIEFLAADETKRADNGYGNLIKKYVTNENVPYMLEPDLSKKPVLGRLDGTTIIPDNFKEPLETTPA